MLTLEEKIKMYIAGVVRGTSEQAGCCDGEEEQIKNSIDQFFSMNDEEFTEYCNRSLVRFVAYGG